MSTNQFSYRDGELVELSQEEWIAHLGSLPTQSRSAWELAAKIKADKLLQNAIPLIGQVRNDLYVPASSEYVALTGIISSLRRLTATTNLSASTDETTAYNIILQAYNTAVASAPSAAKLEYAAAVAQLRRAGVTI